MKKPKHENKPFDYDNWIHPDDAFLINLAIAIVTVGMVWLIFFAPY